ncbi:LOW QUALITY PROTEIN: hypothetical protein Cgig2_028567 [Carnegiea gigantea]|uniref:Uncharacterized protein n=1 Tax=Carnegiea gigantea TaxID=171969 RepID=A0A9Q1K308_9CARY|nr:LOW QUALITY PROTEIN: hypothetical protein Cgig2_028567 [Carnegiea gigantea]
MRHILNIRPGLRNRSKPQHLEGKLQDGYALLNVVRIANALATLPLKACVEHLMLKRPQPMTSAPKCHNARKYYEFHKQNRDTTAECRELRKALHELIDRFLKRQLRFLRKEREPVRPEPREEECSTKIVATITGDTRKVSLSPPRKLNFKEHNKFSRLNKGAKLQYQQWWGEGPHFTSLHSNLLVVEMKVASAIVRRILIDTRSSMDIITWECLKKHKYPGREIEVNPTGIIHLLLCFGDKTKARNLEVDFLVVDVPTAYNAILGRPTLHKLKAADDGSVGKQQGDKRMARECYLVSIQPLVERSIEHGLAGSPPSNKRLRTAQPSLAEALVIHTLASTEPEHPHPEAIDGFEEVPLEGKRTEENRERRPKALSRLSVRIFVTTLITISLDGRSATRMVKAIVAIGQLVGEDALIRILASLSGLAAVLNISNLCFEEPFSLKLRRRRQAQDFSEEPAAGPPAIVGLSHPCLRGKGPATSPSGPEQNSQPPPGGR